MLHLDWRRTCALLACLGSGLVLPVTHPANAAPTARAGFGPPTIEEFDKGTLDTTRWTAYDYPDARPRRSAALVTFRPGVVVLEGSVNAEGQEIGAGLADRLMRQTYGRYEIRFRVDAGAGYGPALLLWPVDEKWPDEGEIDIMEVPGTARDLGFNVVHLGPMNVQRTNKVHADFTKWHTVGVDWAPHELVYYLDGVETWRAPTELVPSTPMRLALQLDECAPPRYHGWIKCRDASSPPIVKLEIDWVKVSPYDPNLPFTPPTTVPPPLTPGPPSTTSPTTAAPGPAPTPPPAQPIVDAPPFTG